MAGLVLTTALLPAPGDAIQLFTSRSDWQTTVDSLGLDRSDPDPFDNRINPAKTITLDSGITSTNDPFSSSTLRVNRVLGGKYQNTVDRDGSDGATLITLLIPDPIRAFGVDVSGAAPTGLQISGNFDGTGPIPPREAYTALGNQQNGFLGLIGTTDFDTILFSAGGTNRNLFLLDDLTTAAAPVPAPLPPLGAAAALAFARRLRSRIARRRQPRRGSSSA